MTFKVGDVVIMPKISDSILSNAGIPSYFLEAKSEVIIIRDSHHVQYGMNETCNCIRIKIIDRKHPQFTSKINVCLKYLKMFKNKTLREMITNEL